MDTLFLVLTGSCSKACPFCFYRTGYLDHPAEELTTGEAILALERAKELQAKSVIFTGGEPLIRTDFPEIARAAGRLGLRRLLLSGGVFPGRPGSGIGLRELAEAVAFSVNSLAEAERLERSAGLLAEFPPDAVTVTTVFHRENLADLPALVDWAGRKGWGMILQPAFIPRASPLRPRFSPSALSGVEWEDLERLLRSWGREFAGDRYPAYIGALYRGGSARPSSCAMGRRSFVIDSDGAVYPCFHRRDLKAGGILRDPLPGIRESLARSARLLASAPCYGEHCVSLFAGE